MGQAVDLDRYRAGQDRFRGAFGNKERFAAAFGQNRNASTAEIEREFAPAHPLSAINVASQNGFVERAANTRLEAAVDARQFE
jgi:hypothetical protein